MAVLIYQFGERPDDAIEIIYDTAPRNTANSTDFRFIIPYMYYSFMPLSLKVENNLKRKEKRQFVMK
jgi:hypothetical protein